MSANPGIIDTEQLLAATDYDRVGDLRRSLDDQRIRYFLGKGGKPWTTIDLINAAAGLVPGKPYNEKIGSEIL